jgi:hypothetical protein
VEETRLAEAKELKIADVFDWFVQYSLRSSVQFREHFLKQAVDLQETVVEHLRQICVGLEVNLPDLFCVDCNETIVRDSHQHDMCVIVNGGGDLVCEDCPRFCPTNCGECIVCEDLGPQLRCGDCREVKPISSLEIHHCDHCDETLCDDSGYQEHHGDCS